MLSRVSNPIFASTVEYIGVISGNAFQATYFPFRRSSLRYSSPISRADSIHTSHNANTSAREGIQIARYMGPPASLHSSSSANACLMQNTHRLTRNGYKPASPSHSTPLANAGQQMSMIRRSRNLNLRCSRDHSYLNVSACEQLNFARSE